MSDEIPDRINRFRRAALVVAEFIDSFSIIPRLIVASYGVMVVHAFLWFKSIATYPVYKCDAAVLRIFIDAKIDVHQAQSIACQITEIAGGPTTAQTALVTAVFGLAPIMFGLYVQTGPRYNSVDASKFNPVPPIMPLYSKKKDSTDSEQK